MKTLKISLTLAEKVKDFVNIVSRHPFEIDLRCGRFVIDAKSLLGIFSLDLSKPLTLEAHSEDCEELFKELEKFAVK